MSDYDYDLFVIGAGSGGVRAARLAAQLGKRVGIAEEYRIGGTCVIRGCVPKKLLVYGSRYGAEIEDAKAFGWSYEDLRFDWETLIHNVQREVDRLNGVYTRTLENAGVERFLTRATVEGPHTVRLADRDAPVSADYILVATGSSPMIPDLPGSEHFVTSNECFHFDALPHSIVILGAGYIGMEFASIFAGLGVEVTVIYRGDQILRGFDMDLRDEVAEALRDRGVDLRMDTNIVAIEPHEGGYRVALTDGDTIHAARVMAATGRSPNTRGLGLEAAGVELGPNGRAIVDAYSKTSVDSIYAVGDVTDRANLTPVAIREGTAFVETVFEGRPAAMDYSVIPTAVFTEPEIGTVGLTEEAARETHTVELYKASFRPMRATVSGRNEKVFMKLVVDAGTDKVLGVHMVGPDAAEIAQMAAISLRLGATKAQFDSTMALHPSLAEELVTMRQRWDMPVPIKGPMRRLEDKIALVTGGGAGIGRAICETFAREGAHVIVADIDGDAAKETADTIVKANGAASARAADITDTAQVKALMETVKDEHGRLDVLVNNAGVGARADFRHLSDEDWDKVWSVNLDGTVRCAREAFDLLRASGKASIVNLSSVMSAKHTRQMAVYSATKGAVSALSRSLAVEYAPYGIRVNTLLPGYVETALIGRYLQNPMIAKALLTQTPLRRFGTPEDIANAALFLASDEAAYITGAALNVDGGMQTTL